MHVKRCNVGHFSDTNDAAVCFCCMFYARYNAQGVPIQESNRRGGGAECQVMKKIASAVIILQYSTLSNTQIHLNQSTGNHSSSNKIKGQSRAPLPDGGGGGRNEK